MANGNGTNVPAVVAGRATQLEEILRARLPMVATILPKHITPERMLRVIFFAIQKVPRLAQCTPMSLMEAMVTCSEYGLEPGPQGHIYLIPRAISVKDQDGKWKREKELRCTVQVGWRGLAELAWRSGALQSPPQAYVICENDEWSYELGLAPNLTHRPALGERGEVVAAYAVAYLKGAERPVWRIMSRAELDRRKAVGAGDDSEAWAKWPEEMYAKTAMRALCTKDLPMAAERSERLYKVIEAENEPPEFTLPAGDDVPMLPEATTISTTDKAKALLAGPTATSTPKPCRICKSTDSRDGGWTGGMSARRAHLACVAEEDRRSEPQPERDPDTGEIVPPLPDDPRS